MTDCKDTDALVQEIRDACRVHGVGRVRNLFDAKRASFLRLRAAILGAKALSNVGHPVQWSAIDAEMSVLGTLIYDY